MTTTTRPLVLNVTEAGNLLGVSRSTACQLVRSGELDSCNCGDESSSRSPPSPSGSASPSPTSGFARVGHGGATHNEVDP